VKRRGVSEVTGSVIMLGIVGTVAAIILTLGLTSIYNFNTFLIDVDVEEDFIKENFIVQFVEFNIGFKTVDLHVRNIGLTDITVDSISIVNIDTQKFILLQTDVAKVVQPKDKLTITTAEVTDCVNFAAPAADCTDANYRITISTGRGNIYEIVVVPLRA